MGDSEGVLAIYNDVIATSTAVYRDDPATLGDRQDSDPTRNIILPAVAHD